MASEIRGSDNFDSGTEAITLGTAVATTSGTSIDFTGIPAGVKRVTIMFDGVSANGTSIPMIQIGGVSIETTGYTSIAATVTTGGSANATLQTTGFGLIYNMTASTLLSGSIILSRVAGSTWVSQGVLNNQGASRVNMSSGRKEITGNLGNLRLTTVNGTDTFDAGSINISYE